MPDWSQAHDNTMDCPLTPVLRVSWSQVRCWHGETVTISVRSSYVKDGGIVDLDIFAMGNGVAVDTIAGLTLNGNSLDHAYTVDWKTKTVPPGATKFTIVATLQNPNVMSPACDPMGVDLIVPVFSA
jgi:hypothetical protein